MLHYFDTDFIRFHSKLWDLCFPSGLWQDLPETCDDEMRPRLLSAILYMFKFQHVTIYFAHAWRCPCSGTGRVHPAAHVSNRIIFSINTARCMEFCNIGSYGIINLLDQIPQPLDYLPVPFMHNGCKWCATIIFSQCQLETVQILERTGGCEHQISERPLRLGRKLRLCWVSFGSPTI